MLAVLQHREWRTLREALRESAILANSMLGSRVLLCALKMRLCLILREIPPRVAASMLEWLYVSAISF
jgi:hypothetical protein